MLVAVIFMIPIDAMGFPRTCTASPQTWEPHLASYRSWYTDHWIPAQPQRWLGIDIWNVPPDHITKILYAGDSHHLSPAPSLLILSQDLLLGYDLVSRGHSHDQDISFVVLPSHLPGEADSITCYVFHWAQRPVHDRLRDHLHLPMHPGGRRSGWHGMAL